MTVETLMKKFLLLPYNIIYQIEYDNSKYNEIGELFKTDEKYFKFISIYSCWVVNDWFYDNKNDELHIIIKKVTQNEKDNL